jgi:hypothetical protein
VHLRAFQRKINRKEKEPKIRRKNGQTRREERKLP